MDKHTGKHLLIGALLLCVFIANFACTQGYSTEQYKALQAELDTTKAELTAVKAELSKTKDDLTVAKVESESLKANIVKMSEVYSSLKPNIELAELILDNIAFWAQESSDQGIKITVMERNVKTSTQTEQLKTLQTKINNPKLTSALNNWWYNVASPIKNTGIYEGFTLLNTLINTSMKDMSQALGLNP